MKSIQKTKKIPIKNKTFKKEDIKRLLSLIKNDISSDYLKMNLYFDDDGSLDLDNIDDLNFDILDSRSTKSISIRFKNEKIEYCSIDLQEDPVLLFSSYTASYISVTYDEKNEVNFVALSNQFEDFLKTVESQWNVFNLIVSNIIVFFGLSCLSVYITSFLRKNISEGFFYGIAMTIAVVSIIFGCFYILSCLYKLYPRTQFGFGLEHKTREFFKKMSYAVIRFLINLFTSIIIKNI